MLCRSILGRMDKLPPPPDADRASFIEDTMSELAEMDISKDMKDLIARGLTSTNLPRAFRTSRAAEAFQHAFDLIGGVPRLAIWADRNPDKFYAIFGRMIPQTIGPVIPQAKPIDVEDVPNPFPWVTAERIRAMQSVEVAEDIKKGAVLPMVKRG